MNPRQLAALKAKANQSADYDDRALAALKRNSPTADDILNNDEFRAELNGEIVSQPQNEIDVEGLDMSRVDLPTEAPAASDDIFATPPTQDLDAELAKIEQALAREAEAKAAAQAEAAESAVEPEPELSQADLLRMQLMELLRSTPGAPTERQIEQLKAKYGQNGVHMIGLGEGDVYIFTFLRRSQWKKIQEVVSKASQTEAFSAQAEDMLKEKVIQHCVLWPQGTGGIEFQYNSRAGVMDTLYECIMMHSYFLNPQQALSLTTTL